MPRPSCQSPLRRRPKANGCPVRRQSYATCRVSWAASITTGFLRQRVTCSSDLTSIFPPLLARHHAALLRVEIDFDEEVLSKLGVLVTEFLPLLLVFNLTVHVGIFHVESDLVHAASSRRQCCISMWCLTLASMYFFGHGRSVERALYSSNASLRVKTWALRMSQTYPLLSFAHHIIELPTWVRVSCR